MKKFILGFITGGIFCAAVTGFAVEYAVTANPYPVKVNGVETTIQGYNINDETYFKLRDVSAAVGGFVVDFKDNAITIDTPQKVTTTPATQPTTTAEPISGVKPTPNPKIEQSELEYLSTVQNQEYTSDGLPIDVWDDGNKYVKKSYIKMVYSVEENGYIFLTNYLSDKQDNKLIDNMVVSEYDDIELNYYETVLRPWLQEHCQ